MGLCSNRVSYVYFNRNYSLIWKAPPYHVSFFRLYWYTCFVHLRKLWHCSGPLDFRTVDCCFLCILEAFLLKESRKNVTSLFCWLLLHFTVRNVKQHDTCFYIRRLSPVHGADAARNQTGVAYETITQRKKAAPTLLPIKLLQRVPGGMCQTSGECSLC